MGKLVLVTTPIGNLADISPRMAETLREADLIAAEDTRHSGLLLHHLGIKKPMLSYYQHNRKEREDILLEHLAVGETVALVTDAGAPAISDPGWELVAAAVEAGHEVDGIPGPCALILALMLSGLPTQRFAFEGFLPRGRDCSQTLEKLKGEDRTLVFYEAPHRLTDTLEAMAQILGGSRQAAVCRELTKKFQEIKRGTLMEILAYFQSVPVRGEFTIVLAPAAADTKEKPDQLALIAEVRRLMAGGMKHKAAAKEVAARYDVAANDLYRSILEKNQEK